MVEASIAAQGENLPASLVAGRHVRTIGQYRRHQALTQRLNLFPWDFHTEVRLESGFFKAIKKIWRKRSCFQPEVAVIVFSTIGWSAAKPIDVEREVLVTRTSLDIEPGTQRKAPDDDQVQSIAERILSTCLGGLGQMPSSGVVSLPSERELSRRLSVTRHAVRNALDHLEENGEVQRVAGRTTLVVAKGNNGGGTDSDGQTAGVRCINFIQGPALTAPALQSLLQHYLAGYTEVLDRYDLKTRFLIWEDARDDYNELLWNRVPWAQQGCILVNRSQVGLHRWLHEKSVPFVVQYYRPYDFQQLPPHHKVFVNKTGGTFKATNHLLELGHQRIGFIGPVPGMEAYGRKLPAPQFEGYQAAIRCAGLTPAENDLLALNAELPELALDACKQYLDRHDRPTAVITANAGMMLGLRQAAESLGLSVPEDLSIVGFGTQESIGFTGATYVELSPRLLAHASVTMLMDVIEKRVDDWQTRILECELRKGATTAAIGG